MDIKQCPLSVYFTIALLLITALFGSLRISFLIGDSVAYRTSPFPVEAVFYAIGFAVLPILAIMDICRARLSGRYLGLLSMMLLGGLLFRAFTKQLAFPASGMVLPLLSLLTGLVLLIGCFGFSKRAWSFFRPL